MAKYSIGSRVIKTDRIITWIMILGNYLFKTIIEKMI